MQEEGHKMKKFNIDRKVVERQAKEKKMHERIINVVPNDPNFMYWNSKELGLFLSQCGVIYSLTALETYNGKTFFSNKEEWKKIIDKREIEILDECHDGLVKEEKYVIHGQQRAEGKKDHDK